MPIKSLEAYLARVEEKLKELEPIISSSQISIERRSPNRIILAGKITFIDGSRLHFLEYVLELNNRLLRVSYRFHYTKREGGLIFRYDNAPHHPELPKFPYHKHIPGEKVLPSDEMNLIDVLDEIKEIVTNEL